MKSVMQHNFSNVARVETPRSTFDRSHGYKTTFDAGYLIPIYLDEALPGDTFNMRMSAFGRLATPIFPIMDNMYVDVHFFFVPNRLVWTQWQKFCGEQTDPGDTTDYEMPYLEAPGVGGWTEGSLGDYFGLPLDIATMPACSLPFRAYNLIYNEWYRDQNLIDSAVVDKDIGPDDPGDYVLRKRCKRHDYFTSCLPWPQKGDEVEFGIGTTAPMTDATWDVVADGTNAPRFKTAGTAARYLTMSSGVTTTAWNANATDSNNAYWDDPQLKIDASALTVDLASATAVTVNEMRQAFQVQKLLEKDARGGTRYVEILKNHFGVTSPDARLQRPEYLGGGTQPINISPIAQTSSTDGTSPQGNLAAMGTVGFDNIGFTHSFTEHGFVMGIASIRADLTYQRGMDRMWFRETRYDLYWPSLAHLGEQAVLSKEIYYGGVGADEDVFGYQERFAEYRYKPSKITGAFRSTAATPLDSWHLSQDFGATRPTLNQTFIEETPPMDRVVAVATEPDILWDSYFNLRCTRPMPMYATPGMIDHF